MVLPFKISTLLFITDVEERLLLIQRKKVPNAGCWSPPGGKLEMTRGESPFETAIREAREEVGLELSSGELHLFGYISEKHFEGDTHWLMFLFRVKRILPSLPPSIDEGHFAFFTREEINTLPIPPTDHDLVWPFWDTHRDGFVAVRADCQPGQPLTLHIEQAMNGPAGPDM